MDKVTLSGKIQVLQLSHQTSVQEINGHNVSEMHDIFVLSSVSTIIRAKLNCSLTQRAA